MRVTKGTTWDPPSVAAFIALGIALATFAPVVSADETTAVSVDVNNCPVDQPDRYPGASSDAEAPEGRAPDVFIFPATGDTRFNQSGTNFWNIGDYVEGDRTFTVATLSMNMVLQLENNVLSCDTQDHDVMVDGVVIGSFMINQNDTQVVATFNFTQIDPGVHTLRIETTRTVNGGCGSSGFANDVSTFDFVGVPVELMSFTIE